MFYHGINREYVYQHFPILSPRRCISHKDQEKQADRVHLIRQFGLEPVHLLEAGAKYRDEECIHACLRFGDTVFAFNSIETPFWQLSLHEIGVPILDLRNACAVYTTVRDSDRLSSFLPGIPIVFVEKFGE